MFGAAYNRSGSQAGSSAPSHFKDLARNAIYQELPSVGGSNGLSATSIRSTPTYLHNHKKLLSHSSYRSLASSVFSTSKRSVRSAPLIYSNSTATIPEDSEPLTTTVEQLINDIVLHENVIQEQQVQRQKYMKNFSPGAGAGAGVNGVFNSVNNEGGDAEIDVDLYRISLGSNLQYQNVPESLIDWNLNVTRCKLMLIHLPTISSVPDFKYIGAVPQLVGDLAYVCHITLILPHISDKELIYTLITSNLYQEHDLDAKFKKSVAEISVKQSRLLQINSPKKSLNNLLLPITSIDNQTNLRLEFKEIALRNYLINLAAAATTAYEYKIKSDELKKILRAGDNGPKKSKLPKDEKKRLWESVRLDVFKRAGLET